LIEEEARRAAAAAAVALYAIKNVAGALTAFPAGWLGDRFGHRFILACGYLLGVGTMVGFALLFITETRSIFWLGTLFALGGVYVAIQEALEPAITADLVPDAAIRGTAMGVLAAINGIGDFVASVGVGALFFLGPQVGFAAAAALMGAGALWLALIGGGANRTAGEHE
jgi:MFS family permease